MKPANKPVFTVGPKLDHLMDMDPQEVSQTYLKEIYMDQADHAGIFGIAAEMSDGQTYGSRFSGGENFKKVAIPRDVKRVEVSFK